MGNIISYYTGDQEFRIGYPSAGSPVTQLHKFRLRGVEFQASNVITQYGWAATSEEVASGIYDVTFFFNSYGTPANFDLTIFEPDTYRLASVNIDISTTLTDTTTIDWWLDKDSDVYDSSSSYEGILFVKSGSYAGAVGDPHIKPVIGSSYDLPHVEDTFLLYSNNNTDYPVTIKAKCWFLPSDKYMRYINKMLQNGYTKRAEHYKKLFENGTYFKYIEIVSGGEHIIFDMESLSICDFTSLMDVDMFSLPSLTHYNGQGAIRIGKIKKAKKGILGRQSSPNTLERTVYVYSPKSTISLRLLKDSRNISTRNGVEFFINKGIYGESGAFIRKDISYAAFGTNYYLNKNISYNNVETEPEYINGTAISYGNLTEENMNQYINSSVDKVENYDYSYEEEFDIGSLLETNTDMILDNNSELSFNYDDEIPMIDTNKKKEKVLNKKEKVLKKEKEKEKEEENFVSISYDYSADERNNMVFSY